MAMLYGSWPEEHPADQMRTVDPGDSLCQAATCSHKKVKCAGSRKNDVWLTVDRSIRICAPHPVASTRSTCS